MKFNQLESYKLKNDTSRYIIAKYVVILTTTHVCVPLQQGKLKPYSIIKIFVVCYIIILYNYDIIFIVWTNYHVKFVHIYYSLYAFKTICTYVAILCTYLIHFFVHILKQFNTILCMYLINIIYIIFCMQTNSYSFFT